MSERIVRGYWDCKFCDNKRIDGLTDECPSCGRRKSDDVKYYMSGPVEEVTESELEAAGISVNECNGNCEDWVCNYCNTLNNFSDDTCAGCGSEKKEATHEYGMRELLADDEVTADDLVGYKLLNPADNPEAEYVGNLLSNYKRRINWEKLLSFLFVSGIVGFVIALAVYLFAPIEETVAVEYKSWSRCVTVEEERTVKEDGWSVPAGGRVYDEKQEIRSYVDVIDHYETVTETKSRQVIDHYETVTETKSRQVVSHYDTSVSYRDNGNGTFTEVTSNTPVYKTEYYTETYQEPVYKTEYYTETRQEPVYRKDPVYDTKYYYEIEKWFFVENYESSGVDSEPYWNESYILDSNERDTNRSGKYMVHYDNGDTRNFQLNEWKDVNIGDGYVITKCRLGINYAVSEVE